MPLSKDLREFIELFNANSVELLVVGGFAVARHVKPNRIDLITSVAGFHSRKLGIAESQERLTQYRRGSLGATPSFATRRPPHGRRTWRTPTRFDNAASKGNPESPEV